MPDILKTIFISGYYMPKIPRKLHNYGIGKNDNYAELRVKSCRASNDAWSFGLIAVQNCSFLFCISFIMWHLFPSVLPLLIQLIKNHHKNSLDIK
jgi:hypothetical protein